MCIRDRLYTGKIINGKQEVADFLTGQRKEKDETEWMVVERPELRIIEDETFERVQEILHSRHDTFQMCIRDRLVSHALHVAKYQERPQEIDYCDANEDGGAVHRCLHAIMHLIEDHAREAQIPVRFAASKLAEDVYKRQDVPLPAGVLKGYGQP